MFATITIGGTSLLESFDSVILVKPVELVTRVTFPVICEEDDEDVQDEPEVPVLLLLVALDEFFT